MTNSKYLYVRDMGGMKYHIIDTEPLEKYRGDRIAETFSEEVAVMICEALNYTSSGMALSTEERHNKLVAEERIADDRC